MYISTTNTILLIQIEETVAMAPSSIKKNSKMGRLYFLFIVTTITAASKTKFNG